MTPDRAADDVAWNRALLDPMFVEAVDEGLQEIREGKVVPFPVRPRSHALLQAHPHRAERLAKRLDRIAQSVFVGLLWFGTAYILAHVLIDAGVGRSLP